MRLAAVLAAAALLAGCGGSGAAKRSAQLEQAPPPLAKQLMTKRLVAKRLDYTWLACVTVGRTYQHVPVTRCNVGFGIDPHVEAYCVVLRNRKLVTNHDDHAIPCRHDDAGWDGTTITS